MAQNKRTVVMVGFLLMMVQPSMELRLKQRIKEIVGGGSSYIGLLMTFPTEELALQNSGYFVPNSNIPWVDLAGRRFNIGKIKGVNVIYVMSGEQTVNAGITVQILVDVFDIEGVVHYGIAGSANDSLSIADVVVPTHVAFTNSWKWKEFNSEKGQYPEMKFGDFDFPSEGGNLLGKIEFTPKQLYSTGKQMQEVFWLPIDSKWLSIAAQLQDLKLEQCLNETYCLPNTPKVVYGLRGSTADIYLDNAAFGEFLFKQLNVSTVDEESAAVVTTCLSNEVPSIVFRGVSDFAGREGKLRRTTSLSPSSLAAINALKVAVQFIGLLQQQATFHDH
ncbi:hypothetical protein UlMin_024825 [Ulmus minor]